MSRSWGRCGPLGGALWLWSQALAAQAPTGQVAPSAPAAPITSPDSVLNGAPEPHSHLEWDAASPSADLGMQAYFLGRWLAAIDLIRAVPAELRSPLQWLYLARAQAQAGQLVEAWDSYTQLEDLEAPGIEGLAANREMALVEGAAVRERIPWAELSLGADAPPGAKVYVDQEPVGAERLGAPYPVNPGVHSFLVEAQGEIWAARILRFEEGQQLPVLLVRTLDNPLTRLAATPAGAEVRGAGEPRPYVAGSADALRWASYGSFGIGAAGLLAGAGFAMSDQDSAGSWAAASFGVGALGLFGGGVLFFVARDQPVRAVLGPSAVGVVGRF